MIVRMSYDLRIYYASRMHWFLLLFGFELSLYADELHMAILKKEWNNMFIEAFAERILMLNSFWSIGCCCVYAIYKCTLWEMCAVTTHTRIPWHACSGILINHIIFTMREFVQSFHLRIIEHRSTLVCWGLCKVQTCLLVVRCCCCCPWMVFELHASWVFCLRIMLYFAI